MPDIEVIVQPAAEIVAVVQSPAQISVSLSVGQGPAGPPGQIIEGTGDLNYVHTQSAAAMLWTINHNLNKFPSVTAFDSAGTQWEGSVEYLSLNTLTIEFSVMFGGTAYLN